MASPRHRRRSTLPVAILGPRLIREALAALLASMPPLPAGTGRRGVILVYGRGDWRAELDTYMAGHPGSDTRQVVLLTLGSEAELQAAERLGIRVFAYKDLSVDHRGCAHGAGP